MSCESRVQATIDALLLLPAAFLVATGNPSTDGTSVSPIISIPCGPQHSSSLASSFSSSGEPTSARSQSVHIDKFDFQGPSRETPKDKEARVRQKKPNLSEYHRIEQFRRERLVGKVLPHSAWCKECQAWVGLDKRRCYYLGMWEKHLRSYHLPVR